MPLKDLSKKAIVLGLAMFDPENCPPQFSQGQAFELFKEYWRQFRILVPEDEREGEQP